MNQNLIASCLIVILIFNIFGCVLGVEINSITNSGVEDLSSLKNKSKNSSSSVIYVNSQIGNDKFNGTIDKPKKTLKAAIFTVKDNGIVNVANGTYLGNLNTNIVVNKSITLNGQDSSNTVIDGSGSRNIFNITGKKVIITGFRFINGNTKTGGAINNMGGLSLKNCLFQSNRAEQGGAVYSKNSLNIFNCSFSYNHVDGSNGVGGAVYTRQGTCKISTVHLHLTKLKMMEGQ